MIYLSTIYHIVYILQDKFKNGKDEYLIKD